MRGEGADDDTGLDEDSSTEEEEVGATVDEGVEGVPVAAVGAGVGGGPTLRS